MGSAQSWASPFRDTPRVCSIGRMYRASPAAVANQERERRSDFLISHQKLVRLGRRLLLLTGPTHFIAQGAVRPRTNGFTCDSSQLRDGPCWPDFDVHADRMTTMTSLT